MLLNVKQAAERLGVSRATVYALCRGRLIRHERHGLGRGKILIPEEALDDYRRRHTVEARGQAPSLPPVKLRHLSL